MIPPSDPCREVITNLVSLYDQCFTVPQYYDNYLHQGCYVFMSVGLCVCLFVNKITQKLMDGFG